MVLNRLVPVVERTLNISNNQKVDREYEKPLMEGKKRKENKKDAVVYHDM